MKLSDLRFRTRFLIIGVATLLGFIVLVLVRESVLAQVKIGGTVYEGIVRRKDLASDLTLPAYTLYEVNVLATEAAGAATAAERTEILGRLRDSRDEFKRSHESWSKRLVDPLTRSLLLDRAWGKAQEYLGLLEAEGFTVLQAGGPAADDFVEKRLKPVYREYYKPVEEAIARSRTLVAEGEEQALDAIQEGKVLSWWTVIGVLAVLGLLMYVMMRSVLGSMRRTTDRMRTMAQADADLTARLGIASKDEIGELAHWIDAFLDKIATLVRAVKRSTIQLRSTATEMAATSHEQESTVSAFGAATNQIAAAVKEITSTGAELSGTMNEVGQVAHESSVVAAEGRRGLGSMEATMGQLATSSGSISSKLSAINEKARDITSVVTTITKVADQTNLLSVNAAIEAEKAGEYGRGFLVVAREIRRLADQTASATLDIEQTVHHMQAAVSAGVMEMDKFSEQVRRSVEEVGSVGSKLGRIIEQVQTMKDRFEQVSTGMRSQTEGAGQIHEAMATLTTNVKTTARSLGEFTAAAEQMKSAVDGLKQELGKFKLED